MLMSISEKRFQKLVSSAVSNSVSDIHIRVGERPYFRMNGDLVPVKTEDFTQSDVLSIVSFMTKKSDAEIAELKEFDGSYDLEGICRLRFNILKFRGEIGIILRILSYEIPNTTKLGLPKSIHKIAEAKNGLVLVTGATGSGKSSTLAAMIDHINKTKPVHILTLEDPIEYIHKSQKARITQREIGSDTDDFSGALRSALRQDPDIILIGEMRDAETISIALKAAETGHLVFGTIHTTDALSTIGRLISMFPPEEQDAVRSRISDSLYATVSQRLIKSSNGNGRVAAQEIMITSPGIRESLSNAQKTPEIYTYLKKGHVGHGSQTFDQHIMHLYLEGKITLADAKANATSPDDFERNLMFADEDKTGII